jgi:hypothetical protein
VDATTERVWKQLSKSFPPSAIAWVKQSKFYGPVTIPFDQIDTDGIKSWSASKQPELIRKFARKIAAGTAHTRPSIGIKGPDGVVLVDGHHRALARNSLGRPVLAYIGTVPPSLVSAAEATHSQQFSSTSSSDDNARKMADAIAFGLIARIGIVKSEQAGVSASGIAAAYLPLTRQVTANKQELASLRRQVKKSRKAEQAASAGGSSFEGWDLSHARKPLAPSMNGSGRHAA